MDKKSHRTAKKSGLVNIEYTLVVIPTIQTVGKYLFPGQGDEQINKISSVETIVPFDSEKLKN